MADLDVETTPPSLNLLTNESQTNIELGRNTIGLKVPKINGIEELTNSKNEDMKSLESLDSFKYFFSFKILKLEFAPKSAVRVSVCLHAGNKEIMTVNKPKIDPKRSGKSGR
jgi:hypothetical protein